MRAMLRELDLVLLWLLLLKNEALTHNFVFLLVMERVL